MHHQLWKQNGKFRNEKQGSLLDAVSYGNLTQQHSPQKLD